MELPPSDPSPSKQIRRLRKPTRIMVRKTGLAAKGQGGGTAVGARAGAPPAHELSEKKMTQLIQNKEKLEAKSEKLNGELAKLRSEHNLTEQERDRLQQFWSLSRKQLSDERNVTLTLEKDMQLMRSRQTDDVTRLHQKMRALVFAAKTQRVAATQTEVVPEGCGRDSRECQTVEQLTKEKASSLLRQSDSLLSAFISELEREKLAAQSDLKYAVVQLEQRMKEDGEFQMRRLREEKQRQLDEICHLHAEQTTAMERQNAQEREETQTVIEQLQSDLLEARETVETLSRTVEEARIKEADQAKDLKSAETQKKEMTRQIAKLTDYQRTFQRDMKRLDAMRDEVAKYRDINEIIMGEFAELEKERDELLLELEKGIHRLDRTNGLRYRALQQRIQGIRDGT